ncbi:choice-of-anchor M domain-containing protein [Solirubrobacter sp. CPCC 204708]|uniref:Choice-of-anchor M domain-containing protein n=1 Tax=Solirubrobacter deserti TaxID=2282478 RepID=A0ABT4RCM9_9ACTN|nr:choice-of-anchor M domain-containing protein [Solirubrobacter deserti]MBE2315642.1 choice-of-anchor M domain-containing protein [Solirubrobacter deserti]MDA0136283.1 choice-of-anchor M domain-containing protein [Solirubrobacter deserti]
MKRLTVVLALMLAFAPPAFADPGPAPAPKEYRVLQKLHTDAISTFLDNGVFALGSKADVFEGLGTRLDPDKLWFHVDDASKLSVPGGWDFLGPAGSDVWIAPQSNPGGTQLWPGFSTESVPAGAITGDQTTLRLAGFEGPGTLELFTIGGFGERTRMWSSDEGIDTFRLGRTHAHANWAFTKPGTYRLTVQATAGPNHAASATYTFVVGALPPDVATTTTVAASDSEITADETVTLTATVSPGLAGYAEFRDGATVLGHSAIADGKATLEVANLGLGKRSLTATFVPAVANLADGSTSTPVEVTVNEPGEPPFSVTGVKAAYAVGDTLSAKVVGATLAEGQQFRWLVRPIGSTSTGSNRQTSTSDTFSAPLDALWDGIELSVAVRAGTTVLAQTPWVPVRVTPVGAVPTVTGGGATLLPGDVAEFAFGGRELGNGETLQWGFQSGVSWIDIPRQLGGDWSYAFPDAAAARLKYKGNAAGAYPYGFGVRVLKDGVTLAKSALATLTTGRRELQAQGHQQLYRQGGTVHMDATAFPVRENDRFTYSWSFTKGEVTEAWGEGAELTKTGLTKAAHDGGTLTLTLRNQGEPAQSITFPIKVTEDVTSQILAFNALAGHYHQGDNVRLQLTVDPAPAAGDTLVWEWKWPGADTWAPLPGVVDNVYAVAAEQALDGVEIRAKLTYADPQVPPAISETRTIHVDDHGAAPRQQVTVTGETTYDAGETATLTAAVVPSSVLSTYRWERKARGASEFTTIAGATGATYAFTAAAADDGAEYRAALVKPDGSVAYGPSPAVALDVAAVPTFVFTPLRDHYHQGRPIAVELRAEPGLAAGDRVDWQWRWPGEASWRAVPGASGLTHTLTAEQALDGVQLRAALVRAGGGDPMLAEPVAIHIDDHGAPPSQKVTVAGDTSVPTGATATLTAAVAPATVLDRFQWYENGQPIAGADAATYAFTAAASRTLTVAVLEPDGSVAYGPSEPITVTVEPVVQQPIGGTVPPTLSLTLGAPARFEPFVPGVAQEYTASTRATVTSSAGDATLAVSEPGHLANGAFTLAQPLRVAFSKSAWTGPVANDAVDITFKQAVAADEPLRTGSYAKTLTFTLSTTQP